MQQLGITPDMVPAIQAAIQILTQPNPNPTADMGSPPPEATPPASASSQIGP
jgi:hypothetical protein